MHYIMAENIFSERTFDMEKTKQKKEKLSLRRTFSNNVFMLKLLHKAAKGRIAIEIAVFAAESIVEFFSWQYLLRYVVNGIEEGKDIISLMPMVIGMCLLNIALIAVKCIWYEIYSGLFYQNAARYFQELVYRKAAKVELACYENPDFYDKYVKALNETTSRADGVATAVSMVVYQSISLMANAALMLTIDPALLLFLIFPLFAIFFVRKSKQTDFDKYTESVKVNRKCEYTRRTFYLAEYAKEKGACAVVKGLRAVSDFEYEFQQALTNKKLNPELETVFVTANAENMYLSSSVVKQVCEFGGDISEFVPAQVCDDIIKRIKERNRVSK